MVQQYIFFFFFFKFSPRYFSITCPILSPWKNMRGTLKCSPPAIQWRPVVNKHVTLVLQENRDNMWDGGAHALLAFDVGGTAVCLVHKIARWQYAFPNQSSFFSLLYSAVTQKPWVLDNTIENGRCNFNGEPVGFKGQENMARLLPSTV